MAREYIQLATRPAQMRHLMDEAVRIAIAKRCVTCIVIPNDLQKEPTEAPQRSHGFTFSGVGYSRPRTLPAAEDLERAAEVLNAGQKVGMLVGAGIKDARAEVMEVAELLGAGVAKAILGKTMLSDKLPYVTGSIGLLGTEASDKMMKNCDTFLMIGTSFPYAEFLPEEGQARGVQIDIESANLGLRYPHEVNLHGDARETLRALIPLLKKKQDRAWREQIEGWVKDWWAVVEARAMDAADPINPQRVVWEMSKRLPENALMSCDSGSGTNWYARHIKAGDGMIGTLGGGMATMCPGVPYITAAKFCHPERPGFAIVGDGAMQMMGISALITIAKYWKEWQDPRLVVLVLNNQDLNQVTWEQRVMEGDPKASVTQDIPDFPYDSYAEQIGLVGLRMSTVDDVEQVWDEALRAERPVVINAYVDPNVPPMPPHITFEQARNYAKSLIGGDPDAMGEIKQTLRSMASKYFHD